MFYYLTNEHIYFLSSWQKLEVKHYLYLLLLVPLPTLSASLTLGSTDYPPYYGPKLENYGVMTEQVQAAFKHQDINTKVIFYPWARLMRKAKDGHVEATYTVWCTAERKKDFIYSHSLFPNKVVFLKSKDLKLTFDQYSDLRSYRIGYVFGYAYPDAFYDEPNLILIKGYSDKENVTRLLTGAVDLVVIDEFQGTHLLKQLAPDKAKLYDTLPKPLSINQQYLMVSKSIKHAQTLIERFNQGLAQIKQDGTFEELLKKHHFPLEKKYWQGQQECNPNIYN